MWSAVPLHVLARQMGVAAPRRQAGDPRSARIEAQAGAVGRSCQAVGHHICINVRDLAGQRVGVGIAMSWRFLARRKIRSALATL